MKLVEYQGRTDGVERPGVRVDGQEYLLNTPIAVSEAAAKKLEGLDDVYKFKVSDDVPESQVPAVEQNAPAGSGGFGGSQGSVEAKPDQE
jgi:hypothetical protein